MKSIKNFIYIQSIAYNRDYILLPILTVISTHIG